MMELSGDFRRKIPLLRNILSFRKAKEEDEVEAHREALDSVTSWNWRNFDVEESSDTACSSRGGRGRGRGGGSRTATAKKRKGVPETPDASIDVSASCARSTRAQMRARNQTPLPGISVDAIAEVDEEAEPPKPTTRPKRGKVAAVEIAPDLNDSFVPSSAATARAQKARAARARPDLPWLTGGETPATVKETPAAVEDTPAAVEVKPPSQAKTRTKARGAKKQETPLQPEVAVEEETPPPTSTARAARGKNAVAGNSGQPETEGKPKRGGKARTKAKPAASRPVDATPAFEQNEDVVADEAGAEERTDVERKEDRAKPEAPVDAPEEPMEVDVPVIVPAKPKAAPRTRRANKAKAVEDKDNQADGIPSTDSKKKSPVPMEDNVKEAGATASASEKPVDPVTEVVGEPSRDVALQEGNPTESVVENKSSKAGNSKETEILVDDSSVMEMPVEKPEVNVTMTVNASAALEETFVVPVKETAPAKGLVTAKQPPPRARSQKRHVDGSVVVQAVSTTVSREAIASPASEEKPAEVVEPEKAIENPALMDIDDQPSSSSSVVESSISQVVPKPAKEGPGRLKTTQEENEEESDSSKENESPGVVSSTPACDNVRVYNAAVARGLSAKQRASLPRYSSSKNPKTPGKIAADNLIEKSRKSTHKVPRLAAIVDVEAGYRSPKSGIPVRVGPSSTVKKPAVKPVVIQGSSTAAKERRLPTFQPRHPSCSPQNRLQYRQNNVNALLAGPLLNSKKKQPGNISTQTSFVKRVDPHLPTPEEAARDKREEDERKKAEQEARAKDKQLQKEKRREEDRLKNEEKLRRAREKAAQEEEEKKRALNAKLKEKEMRAAKQAEEKARRQKKQDDVEERRRAAERKERERREREAEEIRRKKELDDAAKVAEESAQARRAAAEKKQELEKRKLEELRAEEKKKEERRREKELKKREQERVAALAAANAPVPSSSAQASAMDATFVVGEEKKQKKKTKKKYAAYNIDHIATDADTDCEDSPTNPVPAWARDRHLHKKLCQNFETKAELKRTVFPRLPNPTAAQLFDGMATNFVERDDMTMIWEREPTWDMTYDQEHYEALDRESQK